MVGRFEVTLADHTGWEQSQVVVGFFDERGL